MSHDPGDEDTPRVRPVPDVARRAPPEILDRLVPIMLAHRAAQAFVVDDARWEALALHAAGMRDAIREARAAGRLPA